MQVPPIASAGIHASTAVSEMAPTADAHGTPSDSDSHQPIEAELRPAARPLDAELVQVVRPPQVGGGPAWDEQAEQLSLSLNPHVPADRLTGSADLLPAQGHDEVLADDEGDQTQDRGQCRGAGDALEGERRDDEREAERQSAHPG